jgi:hypothetical protein
MGDHAAPEQEANPAAVSETEGGIRKKRGCWQTRQRENLLAMREGVEKSSWTQNR